MLMTNEEIVAALHHMEINPYLVTKAVYRGDAEQWPGNKMSFVEYHMEYLRIHPNLDPTQYLANLRLMLRKNP